MLAMPAGRTPPLKHIPVDGKPVRARFAQMRAWLAVVGALAALFVAGLYFGILEVNWYIHAGGFYVHLFWLKKGWDGGMGIVGPHTWLINSANWVLYRHDYRDKGEPALATMAVLSLLAARKYWGRKAGRVRLAVTPVLLVALAFVLITAACWLQFFGLPAAWHHLFGARHIYVPALASVWAVAETLLFGVLVGLGCHLLWGPVGGHIQGSLVDRMVDRYWRRGGGVLPWYIRWDVLPPVIRERFCEIVAADQQPGEGGEPSEAQKLIAEGLTARSRAVYWLTATAVLVVLGIVFLGFVGHYVAGTGHTFPYLAPNG